MKQEIKIDTESIRGWSKAKLTAVKSWQFVLEFTQDENELVFYRADYGIMFEAALSAVKSHAEEIGLDKVTVA